MKKVLIFGIGGFVGRYLTREFKNHGYHVWGSDITPLAWHDNDVFFSTADLLDFEQIRKLIMSVSPDCIVNLAAISSVGQSWKIPQTTFSVNVIGPLNILQAAKECEVSPRVMFIGSSEEYMLSELPISEETPLNANNPYGISKMTQERLASLYRSEYGMKVYCVRAFNHTGIGQRDSFVLPSWCKQAAEIELSGRPGTMLVGNLEAERDFSDVRDIVRAYRMIIESEDCSVIYNVGSGKSIALRHMLEWIVSLSKQKIEVKIDESRIRPTDTKRICCDNTLIKEKLGWKPEFEIFDTLKEMFEFYEHDHEK